MPSIALPSRSVHARTSGGTIPGTQHAIDSTRTPARERRRSSTARELDLIGRLLAPDGALYLSYEPPAGRIAELTDQLVAGLTGNGFTTTTLTGGAGLLCVVARSA